MISSHIGLLGIPTNARASVLVVCCRAVAGRWCASGPAGTFVV